MDETTTSAKSLALATRLSFVLLLVCCALFLVVMYLVLRPSDEAGPAAAAALRDPEIRARVIADLVEESSGIYDSHVDSDVGRVNLPNLAERRSRQTTVSTNRFGLRERDYEMPKPPDVVRVVLLGDSFVFGYGVTADSRFGAHLERELNSRSGTSGVRVECLHMGVSSWNFQAETAYLRRQLTDLDPDLVILLSLPNDLEESVGTRGFGVWSSFSSQQRRRADSVVSIGFAMRALGFSRAGFLLYGLDYESRSRYSQAVADLRRLGAALETAGSGYRVLFHHRQLLPVTHRYLGSQLKPGQAVYLSEEFGNDRQYWNSPRDHHWNPAGHQRAATMIYGLIVRDGLLPRLELEPWEEAERVYSEIAIAGQAEAEAALSLAQISRRFGGGKIASSIDFSRLDAFRAAQIHGGVDQQARVSPYASVVLKNDAGARLKLVGRAFPQRELDGTVIRVFVDDDQVGQIELRANAEFLEFFAVPDAARDREFVSVRLESSDYVYAGEDLQHCVVFWLDELAIES